MSRATSATCGLILLGLGALLFLSSLGWIRLDFWQSAFPLLLILLGILTLWTVVTRGGALEQVEVQVPLETARSARLRFRFGAGHLRVGAGAHTDHLLEISARGGVRTSASIDGGEKAVEVWVPPEFFGDAIAPWKWWGGEPPRWDARLRAGLPLHLDLEIGACEAEVDLTDLLVREFRLATGASSTTVRMPTAAGETRGRITGGAASVKVMIPPGVAARVVTQIGLGEVKVDQHRFPGSGPIYQSADYTRAKHKVDLSVEVGAASVEVW